VIDRDALTTYLDDHLAGAQAALALLDRLEPDPGDGLDVRGLQREIEADRGVLEGLVGRLGERPSDVKKAAGWVAGRLSRPKLADDGALGRFEALEVLALGILGKHSLWCALAELEGALPELAGLGLDALRRRALAQHERVEHARLACARRAFLPPAD
jgi:hypothetical protein